MREFSFCCNDSASADGFGKLREGDEGFSAGLVEDVGEYGPGLPETALEADFDVIGLDSSSMSNIASERTW